jgi:hypothetical protein
MKTDIIARVTEDQMSKGHVCDACGQLVKLYKRRLNNAMAYALILLNRREKTDDPFFHVPTYLSGQTSGVTVRGGDWAKLVYWDLIEPLARTRADGSKRSGFYRLTDKGRQFAEDKITLPRYAFVFNQTLYGFSDGLKYPKETTTIREALGAKFNYAELMGDDAAIRRQVIETLAKRKAPHRTPKRGA